MLQPSATLLPGLDCFGSASVQDPAELEARRGAYRCKPAQLWHERAVRELFDVCFYAFGLDARDMFVYRNGASRELPGGRVVREWQVRSEPIVPPPHTVKRETADGRLALIREDEAGLWIEQDGARTALNHARLHLPDFAAYTYPYLTWQKTASSERSAERCRTATAR